jgi:hypothetical protein
MLQERSPELGLISAINLLSFLFFSIDCSYSPILTRYYIVLHGKVGFLPAILGRAGMETWPIRGDLNNLFSSLAYSNASRDGQGQSEYLKTSFTDS